jgi:hypothetical protein
MRQVNTLQINIRIRFISILPMSTLFGVGEKGYCMVNKQLVYQVHRVSFVLPYE